MLLALVPRFAASLDGVLGVVFSGSMRISFAFLTSGNNGDTLRVPLLFLEALLWSLGASNPLSSPGNQVYFYVDRPFANPVMLLDAPPKPTCRSNSVPLWSSTCGCVCPSFTFPTGQIPPIWWRCFRQQHSSRSCHSSIAHSFHLPWTMTTHPVENCIFFSCMTHEPEMVHLLERGLPACGFNVALTGVLFVRPCSELSLCCLPASCTMIDNLSLLLVLLCMRL